MIWAKVEAADKIDIVKIDNQRIASRQLILCELVWRRDAPLRAGVALRISPRDFRT